MDFNVLEAMHEDATCELVQHIRFIQNVYSIEEAKRVTRELDLSVFSHILFKEDKIILTLKNRIGIFPLLKWLKSAAYTYPTIDIMMTNYTGEYQHITGRVTQANWVLSPQMVEVTFTLYGSLTLKESSKHSLVEIISTEDLPKDD